MPNIIDANNGPTSNAKDPVVRVRENMGHFLRKTTERAREGFGKLKH